MDTHTGQPHIVSLVLQSKKALQHGEVLCSRASTLVSSSAQTAADVLALDAKVRWLSGAVLEQLKMAAHVAKSIEQKRSLLEKQVKEWDSIRSQRADALDSILDSLGAQVVPPDFQSTSTSDISPFGIQYESEDEHDHNTLDNERLGCSPTDTVRDVPRAIKQNGVHKDRSTWKTLRDFVDERAIEDVLDIIETDRNALDDILARTSDYPESLSAAIHAIESSIPTEVQLPSIQEIFTIQDTASTRMASHLESLAAHYEQMSSALREHEAGEEFHPDDLQAMNRDTEELPAIISELEEGIMEVEASHEKLLLAKHAGQQNVDSHRDILNELDELGDIMSEMLERQQTVENECEEHLRLLYEHLGPIEDLHHRFTSYQYSYNKLLLELARRRQYTEASDHIVMSMITQLNTMAEEEQQLRADFHAQHGQYLPEDVCLYVQNAPTQWKVVPKNGEQTEVLPEIQHDLLQEARTRVQHVEGALVGIQSQSLT